MTPHMRSHQDLYPAKVDLDNEDLAFSTDPTSVDPLRTRFASENVPTLADHRVSTALITDRAGREACLP